MRQKYLLDTNAFFNLLDRLMTIPKDQVEPEFIKVSEGECYISYITLVEIISVIGKKSRGQSFQKHKCNSIISEAGDICEYYCFKPARKRWNKKLIAAWIKLVKEISRGISPVFQVRILPINETVLKQAEQFILYSLTCNFGSLDAIIAATAQVNSNEENTIIVVTSDKGLKAGMRAASVQFIDPCI